MEFLGDRRAPDDVPPLEHADLQPGTREIEGADEAVMPTADDDRVVFLHGYPPEFRRCAAAATSPAPARGAAGPRG